MKKTFAVLALGLFLLPAFSFAATPQDLQISLQTQLIQLLLTRIQELESQVASLRSGPQTAPAAPVATSTPQSLLDDAKTKLAQDETDLQSIKDSYETQCGGSARGGQDCTNLFAREQPIAEDINRLKRKILTLEDALPI